MKQICPRCNAEADQNIDYSYAERYVPKNELVICGHCGRAYPVQSVEHHVAKLIERVDALQIRITSLERVIEYMSRGVRYSNPPWRLGR